MYCGLDMGSRNVKLAVMNQQGELVETRTFDTMKFYSNYGRRDHGKLIINFAAIGLTDIKGIVATGYGRNALDMADAMVIPELKAHALGAVWQTGLADFTLLDLGGQDSKVIKVKNGKMVDFQTNDKCAASTGRYLENMAQALEISLDELSEHWENPAALSSTCAIFGESELIGKILDGHSIAELAAGVNYTIFRRVRPMLAAMSGEVLVFTGGVAKSEAIRKIVAAEAGFNKIIVPLNPQHNGAIGCCTLAHRGSAIIRGGS